MITGISVNDSKQYICRGDDDNPTVWVIGTLKKSDILGLLSNALTVNGSIDQMALSKRSVEIIRAGLKCVKNYKINNCDQAKDYPAITDDLIESIPISITAELASEIISFNFAGNIDEKN